jgi:hypothetical protein
MIVRPFTQWDGNDTTGERIKALIDFVGPQDLLFCFAYATFSGCAEFQRRFGDGFWNNNKTRWLFGVDYGRTQSTALDFIAGKPNTTIKLMNGADVVGTPNFFPNQDFHMKACFASNKKRHRFGMIIGSGNFSRNGLINSIEAGTQVTVRSTIEYNASLKGVFASANALWNVNKRPKVTPPPLGGSTA